MNRDEFFKQWLDVQSKYVKEYEDKTGIDTVTGTKKKKRNEVLSQAPSS